MWFCHLAHCRIGATLALRRIQYNTPIRLLAQVFPILSTEGHSQLRYWSQIDDTLGVALPTHSTGYLRKLITGVLGLETRDCTPYPITISSPTKLHAQQRATERDICMKLQTTWRFRELFRPMRCSSGKAQSTPSMLREDGGHLTSG